MESAVAWLNENGGVLTLLFSFVVTCATVFYVLLTRQLVGETKRLRYAQAQPHVSVRIESNRAAFGFVDLVVENLGQGPAYKVGFVVEKDIDIDAPGRRLSDIGFLRHGFRYLAPGQAQSTYILSLVGMSNETMAGPDKLESAVTVTYSDVFDKKHSETFPLDLTQFVNLTRLGTPPLLEIAKELKKLQSDIHRVATGFSRMKVVAYTPDDVRHENEEFRRRIAMETDDKGAGQDLNEPSDAEGVT